jgi:hypothetical protein
LGYIGYFIRIEMTTCAVCQLSDGLVVNIIVAEPTDPYPQQGCQLIVTPDQDGNNANIGWIWNGTDFVEVAP